MTSETAKCRHCGSQYRPYPSHPTIHELCRADDVARLRRFYSSARNRRLLYAGCAVISLVLVVEFAAAVWIIGGIAKGVVW